MNTARAARLTAERASDVAKVVLSEKNSYLKKVKETYRTGIEFSDNIEKNGISDFIEVRNITFKANLTQLSKFSGSVSGSVCVTILKRSIEIDVTIQKDIKVMADDIVDEIIKNF